MSLGSIRAELRSVQVNTTFLSDYRQGYRIGGWIEEVQKSGNGYRWQLRVDEISRLRSGDILENPPKRVRVKADIVGFEVGDTITVKALMTAPPGPIVPHGYDPARRAYFNGLGGYGFAIGKPETAEPFETSVSESLSKHVAKFRYSLAERIRSQAPEETAGLQAALLTGVRAYVSETQTEVLRVAGLAHVLAISGLHMGLLAGSGYFLATLGFSMISPLARRYDVRKFASVIGMLMATGYLMLSGSGVSTQRAYIMAMIVFVAVLLDRRAFSLRSVTVAAFITLMLHPEELMSAGFQMSFAAATALVAFYSYWRDLGLERYEKGIWPSIKRNVFGITLTSVVAGAATAGFAVLHFNRIARYSLLGNLLAMPIFTFWVMPAALAALIAVPLGLEALPLWIMGQGLSLIITISTWVSKLDGAIIYLPSVSNIGMALYAAGFTAVCIGRPVYKALGGAAIVSCIVIAMMTPLPSMRVSDSGKIAFWGSDRNTLFVERVRTDRYGRDQFIQRAGKNDVVFEKYTDTLANCDSQACQFTLQGHTISVVKSPEAAALECEQSAVIILVEREVGPRTRRHCKAAVLDSADFKSWGATDIYVSPRQIRFSHSNPNTRQKRPWAFGAAPKWTSKAE